MYALSWNIEFDNGVKKFKLAILYSVEIEKSVENLVDFARIYVPESISTEILDIESKIPRGTKVSIELGYDNNLLNEFKGYVKETTNKDGSLVIECEDTIFLFRKPVESKVYKPTSVAQLAQSMIDQCAPGMNLNCTFDIGYEKFVVHLTNGFDVLSKIQSETKANIWIDTNTNTLNVHPPFIEKSGEVKYVAQQNVQSISLEYKRSIDRQFEVTVESVSSDGQKNTITTGSSSGEKIKFTVGPMSKEDMKKIANSELRKRMSDRYEGSITTWLLPHITPTSTARYLDRDYPEKEGGYYVPTVRTSLSDDGGTREVIFGIKTS